VPTIATHGRIGRIEMPSIEKERGALMDGQQLLRIVRVEERD